MLRQVRRAILAAAPEAKESLGYGMPFCSLNVRLAWLGLLKGHIGLFVRPRCSRSAAPP
jgi:uncharacterized protein YdhG (YjbR/CyaY superfamily)